MVVYGTLAPLRKTHISSVIRPRDQCDISTGVYGICEIVYVPIIRREIA